MSHFTVLVISPDKLDQETLRSILQPWHEYECTGTVDQYVIDVDVTDEVKEQFDEPRHVVVLSDGSVHCRYDQRFYTKEPEKKASWDTRKEFELPAGAAEQEMAADEARKHGIGYKTMAECATEYFGAFERDGRFFNKTNPNRKWDWWQVGGRWSDMIRLRGDVAEAMRHVDLLTKRRLPIPDSTKALIDGVTMGERSWTLKNEPKLVGHCDIARKRQIDFDAMRDEAEKSTLETHAKAAAIIAGRPFETWEEVRERFKAMPKDNAVVPADGDPWKPVRDFFHAQPVIVDLKAAELLGFFDGDADLKMYRMSPEDVALRARRRALQTFAVVKDGQWFERGSMGWWGCVSDEKDPDAWDQQFSDLLDGLPDDTSLAVVDCHI